MDVEEECYCYEIEGCLCDWIKFERRHVFWLVWDDVEVFVYMVCGLWLELRV